MVAPTQVLFTNFVFELHVETSLLRSFVLGVKAFVALVTRQRVVSAAKNVYSGRPIVTKTCVRLAGSVYICGTDGARFYVLGA